MKIGLTGGIGCGKSTVLKILKECGAEVAETDAIAKRILNEDPEVREELRKAFGGGVFDEQGTVDRVALASIVFGNPERLRVLESLLHPRVRAEWTRLSAESKTSLVVEIPLLFEKSLQSHFELTLCVAASQQTCVSRLLQRGLSEEQIKQRQANQLPLSEKMERADVVILNNGSLDCLRQQIKALLPQLGLSAVR
jgi:dephospho-CoA kinase